MKKYLLSLLMPALIMSPSALALEESQDIVLKFRGLFNTVDAKQSELPNPYTQFAKNNPQEIGKMFAMGVGGEASVEVFLNDNFAGEFSTGLTTYRGKSTAINNILLNYNSSPTNTKKKDLYTIPSSLSLQYHIAPYGAVRPYIGGGFHYTYMIAKASEYKVNNGSGPVIQAGVDVVFQDDTYINLDVKQYILKTKVRYNKSFITDSNNNAINSSIKMNPASI